jgi:hypothetical protein
MSYELEEVIGCLEDGRNRRRRPSEQRWRSLNHLSDEDVIELTLAAYQKAADQIHLAIQRLPEDEQDGIRQGVSSLFTGRALSAPEDTDTLLYMPDWNEETITMWYGARLNLDELADSYTFVADYAYHKFIDETKEGRSGGLMGLITGMQDPQLAKRLLKELSFASMPTHTSSYATERVDSASSLKSALENYSEQKWREKVRSKVVSDNIGTLGALALKRKVARATQKGKGKNKRYKEQIIDPLKQTAELPPVPMQLLYRTLGGEPKKIIFNNDSRVL